MSVNTAGDAVANAWCYDQVISGDGQSVAYTSVANNLAQGDTNDWDDVFLRDLVSPSTILISRSPQAGSSGNGESAYPALSHDGNRIGFLSYATDLVEPAGFWLPQAFLHDRQSHITIRVNDSTVAMVKASTPKLSPDGRYLAYVAEPPRFSPGEAWIYDDEYGQREEILPGTAVAALDGDFSRDGRYLVTWVLDYYPQGQSQIFLMRRELNSGINERIWLGPNRSRDLVELTLDDVGRFVALSTSLGLVPADTNERSDVYLLEFESQALTLISLNS